MECKKVEFNGETYIRSPKSRYYFKYTTKNEERRNAKQLHRAVWEYYNGQIPAGWQVHHIDGNIDNNDISNLECLPAKDHLKRHAMQNKQNPDYKAKQNESLNAAREAAKKWHASEAGREWHRQHVENSLGKVLETRVTKKCEFCGREFDGKPWARYCSLSCGDKARRRKRGLKFEPHEAFCKFCGKPYIAKKWNSLFCSVDCKYKQYKADANDKCEDNKE